MTLKFKTKVYLFILTILPTFSMLAQYDSAPLKAKFGKVRFHSDSRKANWFLSIGGGGQLFLSNNFPQKGNYIHPAASLSFGKMLAPEWGIRMNVNGGEASVITQTIRYGTVNLDMLLHLSTITGGYYEWRPFEFSLFYGPGYLQTLKHLNQKATQQATFHAGAILSFRLSRFTNLNFEFQHNTTGFPGEDGLISMATAGVNIKIGKRRYTAYVPEEILSEQGYRETLLLKAEIDKLKKQVENADKKPKIITVHDTIYIKAPVRKPAPRPDNPLPKPLIFESGNTK